MPASPKTTRKKRVEIVLEHSLLESVIELVDDVGASGYTMLPCLGGRGNEGPWRAGDLSPAFERVCLIVIASPEITETLLQRLHVYLERYSAVVSVQDTEVIRGDRF